MRVLHVLHHSAPYLDGYGVRSKAIVEFQRSLGLDPVVLTSAHHEQEVERIPAAGEPPSEAINGITYHRTALGGGALGRFQMKVPFLRERALMRALSRSLTRTLAVEPVDLIHAHSPVLCGLPALQAARRRGVPLVYEVRAFWEDALLSSKPSLAQALKYRYSRGLETGLFRQADAVVAISYHMLDDIEARGIPRERLHRVPNGVDVDRFVPVPPDLELAGRLHLTGCPVVGFIGSFFHFEGLDCLVRAMPAVLSRVPEAKLVLVGTGEADGAVRGLIAQLGLQESVLQLGRVPHTDVLRYYSIMDLLVYPRHRDRVTQLVTPLKPLEAMALGKPVLGSDVGGIKELLDDGRAGALFAAGDAEDLARRVVDLLGDAGRRQELSARGREYVLRERRWDAIVSRYLPIYEDLLAKAA